MRIISGKHRGKRIESLDSKELRPTTGRTKEALFNMLTHGQFSGILEGANVLDLFCGCGALSAEAFSHGAAKAVLVDKNPDHLNVARKNMDIIGESENSRFLRTDSSHPPPAQFVCHVLFMDPPYSKKLVPITLKNLRSSGWLDDETIIVLETEKRDYEPLPEGYEVVVDRTYGASRIRILQCEKECEKASEGES
jgi:16S rRNA (guanine966-N2)-methyltransferase